MDEWLGHPIKALFLFCLTILTVTLTAKEPIRTWTSADGRTLQAEYISSSAGKVTIKMGSQEYTLPLSRFSPADQQYVDGLASKPAPAIIQAESRDARTYAKEEKDWEGYLKGGAIVVDFSGDVQVKAPAPPDLVEKQYGPDWEDPKKEQILTAGFALRTREGSNIRLLLTNGTLVTLSPVSEAKILTFFQETIAPSNRTFKETTEELSPSMVKLELSLGEMIVETKKLDKGSTFDIYGPVAAAGIRGTAFRLRASEGEQSLEVLRGQVDCQQGSGRITSVIGGQANTASKGRIEDPEGLSDDAGGAIKQTLSALGEQVGGLTIAQLSEKHEAANPPLEIYIQEDGFEAELRRMIRRPRGKILQQDYDRVGKVAAGGPESKAKIKDIRFVENLTNLKIIFLSSLPISDLKPLAKCSKLETANLKDLYKITTLHTLQNLENLKNLRISNMSQLKDLERTVSRLIKLELLVLWSPNKSSIGIKSWQFVTQLNKLKELGTLANSDFLNIAKQKNISTLRVFLNKECKLPNLESFKDFKNLETIEFEFYKIKSQLSENDINKLKSLLPEVKILVREI